MASLGSYLLLMPLPHRTCRHSSAASCPQLSSCSPKPPSTAAHMVLCVKLRAVAMMRYHWLRSALVSGVGCEGRQRASAMGNRSLA